MSDVIKGTKIIKNRVLFEHSPDSISAKKKKRVGKRDAGSLDFTKTISTEVENLKESLSHYIQQQADSREKELEDVSRTAEEKGYQAGFDAAVEKERSERLTAIDMLLKDAKQKSKNAMRGLELKVIGLAVHIAEQITRRSIAEYPEITEEIITETMTHLIGSETVILKVSEEDFKTINARYDKWLNMSGSSKEFRIEVERRLKPGDCLIETEGGIIDAAVANRLEMLAEELAKVSS